MSIKEKHCKSDRFRSVENLDSLYMARIRNRNVTRTADPNRLIIGDAPDVRECTQLHRDTILYSRRDTTNGAIDIIFSSGKILDVKRRTINGEETFIFRDTPDTEIILQKHTAKEKIIATLEVVSEEELRVIYELCCESLGRQRTVCWWSRDSAEQYIVSQLEAMGLQELRELAALFWKVLPIR